MLDPDFYNTKVYIYCSGKSGSSSLYNSFNKYFKTSQVHSSNFFSTLINNRNSLYNNNIFDYIESSCNKHSDVYFIDSYRLPLERSISSFFQGIEKIEPNYVNKSIEYLIDLYNKYHYKNEDYFSIDEILHYFNINEFTNSELNSFHTSHFIHKQFTFNSKNIHIILLKFNSISDWSNILSNIFKFNITIDESNESKEKPYFNTYNKFRENYTIHQEIIDYFINEPHFLKYNTLEDQENYRRHLKKYLKLN